MPWYKNIVPENIKKNVCIYLLQRYLGKFFEEKITRDQLTLNLSDGRGSVEKVRLDVQALNELSDSLNWPLEFVDGYIESLHVYIPWTAVLAESSLVEVKGLQLTLQPKQRQESATSMFESMWNSMTSSMQLAEECAKQDASNLQNSSQPYEGIENFAQTIESILRRVKVKFIDTIIQLEHVPKDSKTGVGIVINIDLMEYFDEAGNDNIPDDSTHFSNQDSKKAYIVQSYTVKRILLEGVTFSTVEFSIKARTFSRSVISEMDDFNEDNEESFNTMFGKSSLIEESKVDELKETKSAKTILDDYRHLILFGKISSVQEIRVKLKQSENVSGPKVSVDINFGSLILFLSPRQFHVLSELANGLASPDIQDTSNVNPKSKCIPKPMTGIDYQRVEQELQQQIQPLPTLPLTGLQVHGWSTALLDESDPDDNFLPMKNADGGMYDSSLSGSMESSVNSSFATSVTETSYRQKKLSNMELDPTAEISYFQIRLSSLAFVLLHEDLLVRTTDLDDHILSLTSVLQMQEAAKEFFSKLGAYVPSSFGNNDFELTGSIFDKACNVNHLRLIAAPVQIEVHEKTTSSTFSITTSVTLAKLIIFECLYDPTETIALLSFNDNKSSNTTSPNVSKPDFKMSIKHVEKSLKHFSPRKNSFPKTDIVVSLARCSLEFDITIVDRLTALLNPPKICVSEITSYNHLKKCDSFSVFETNVKPDSHMDLKVTSPAVNWIIRFPIPDFRPIHDLNRTPWWKRKVRPDFLSIILSEASLQTVFRTGPAYHEFQIQSRGFEIFYYETESSPSLAIAKGGFQDSTMQDILLQTRLTVKLFPKKNLDLFESNVSGQDFMSMSINGAFENQHNSFPSPFSAKKVVHESDTAHPRSHTDNLEELIIPGDKHEIEEFILSSSSCCKTKVEIFLPTLSLHFKSKHIYELIYNRINNDLLLWEPSAPKQKLEFYENNTSIYQNVDKKYNIQDTFGLCKSGIQYDSDSESEDESDIGGSNIFYSAYDIKKKSIIKQKQFVNKQKLQSSLVLTIDIGQGISVLNPPARESGSNNVVPGQQAEFLLNVDDANIFVVSGYEGDENLSYICVQVHSANLFHCEMMSIPNPISSLKDIGSAIGKHLHPTIHKSEAGILACSNNRGGSREMVTVSVRVQANHDTHHVKTVQVAVGLNKATLRHRMWSEPNSWISQLLDFFDVKDYPITNYRAKDVLTELYLHLWDCAVDYRPLYLPMRSVITVGNFSMSSHLSASANCSTLRFIFEECGLFVSEKCPPRNGVASTTPVDLKRDYVNLIQLGLFELSLKTSDKRSGINPHIDLRASNNILNIHTCFDSCKMLMQLITYVANDGDLMGQFCTKVFETHQHKAEEELVSLESMDVSNLSKSQHEHVNDLLGDAMEESEEIKPKEGESNDGNFSDTFGAEMFLFPGEHQQEELDIVNKPLPLVTCELGDVKSLSNKSSDTDDDFCIIGNDEGLGIFPKNGLPEIKWLTCDPVRVVDNYFGIPVGRNDLFKAPKHYPIPVMRYTLCDMTIIWHMYGGNDFTEAKSSDTKKKAVNFSETQFIDSVNFSNMSNSEVVFTTKAVKEKENLPWMQRGGLNRNLNVHMELQLNKVRFQHEIYPDTTKQASRQILSISEVEVRDRLESSEINKFLYQYTSQSKPKQSNANMVLVKALHIRPDPKLTRQECCLKISILPLRFNIDQDALLFLISFFQDLSNENATDSSASIPSKQSTPSHQPPVMTVDNENKYEIKEQVQKIVNENLIMLLEDSSQEKCTSSNNDLVNNITEDLPVYFRNVIFSPEVPIRLDYHGKRVDMSHGSLPGLLMGLGQLNCSELTLKRITYRHGLLGFNKLLQHLLQEWLSDIKKNQLPGILGGVGPLHSVLQLFQGVKDLFWLPIEQYQKDGRIVRGLQRGANSFTTSTAMAALELTTRLIHLIQITAETAYDMLSPGPSLKRFTKIKGKKKRYHRPQDIREGMTNALMLFKEGLGETAGNIVQVASIEKEQKGYSGAVGGVLRQIPPTIIKPIIIASEATNNVLGGMRSQLVPDARQEANQKWRSNKI